MKQIFKALVDFQSDIGPILKDDLNPHFGKKFTSIKQMMEQIRPLLKKHGLAVVQFPCNGPDETIAGCRTMVVHISGECLEGQFFVPLGAKVDAQRAVAAVSYARRVSLSGALGLVSSDDLDNDGEDLVDRQRPALTPPVTPNPATARPRAPVPGPAMSKPSREKLKFCVRERLKELKIEDVKESDVIGVITAFAVTKDSTPKSLKEDLFGEALEWIQAWEPGA